MIIIHQQYPLVELLVLILVWQNPSLMWFLLLKKNCSFYIVCIIIMNLQKNLNHPFGRWYEYVTGQKSPNLHHPTENWRETVTNFPFDPLLIPICSTQDWPPLIIGSMAKWNVLPIWDCCCAVISTAVHNFTVLSIPEMEKKIYYFESFVVALIRA